MFLNPSVNNKIHQFVTIHKSSMIKAQVSDLEVVSQEIPCSILRIDAGPHDTCGLYDTPASKNAGYEPVLPFIQAIYL